MAKSEQISTGGVTERSNVLRQTLREILGSPSLEVLCQTGPKQSGLALRPTLLKQEVGTEASMG